MNGTRQSRRWRTVRSGRAGWGAVFALTCVSCASDPAPDSPPDCPPLQPTFRVIVESPAALPQGLTILVEYGGQSGRYDVDAQRGDNGDVCCTWLTPDVGPPSEAITCGNVVDASTPTAIACDLWTNMAARVTLSASGLPPQEHQLGALRDPECGIQPELVRVSVGDADAGALP